MLTARRLLVLTTVALAAFIGGRWSQSSNTVRADSGDNAQIDVREISGGSSLVVFYPSLKKAYIYQNPFVGLPTWPCAYSIQLSTPGGSIVRQPCSGGMSQ